MELVQVDKINQTFQVHGIIPASSKKNGIIGKSFKGLMAISTAGISLAAEK